MVGEMPLFVSYDNGIILLGIGDVSAVPSIINVPEGDIPNLYLTDIALLCRLEGIDHRLDKAQGLGVTDVFLQLEDSLDGENVTDSSSTILVQRLLVVQETYVLQVEGTRIEAQVSVIPV